MRRAVEQAKVAIRAAEIEFFIELTGVFEFSFHLIDDFESAQAAGLGELAEIHAEIIMRLDQTRLARHDLARNGNAFFGHLRAIRVIGRGHCAIETRAR